MRREKEVRNSIRVYFNKKIIAHKKVKKGRQVYLKALKILFFKYSLIKINFKEC